MTPALYYLVGWPAAGKRTVGMALAELTGARLIDNHLINDPIFQAVGATGVGKLPEGAWPLVRRIEAAVLEAVAKVAPPGLSHIFTNYLKDAEDDRAVYEARKRLAAARNSRFVPVWLLCDVEELCRRVALEDRRARLKMRDPVGLSEMLARGALLSPPPGALVLKTTRQAPREVARHILEHARSQA